MKINPNLYSYYVIDRTHRTELRRDFTPDLASEYSALGLSDIERMTRRFELLCAEEVAHIHPDEKIVLMRTIRKQPEIFTEDEWAKIKSEHFIHER